LFEISNIRTGLDINHVVIIAVVAEWMTACTQPKWLRLHQPATLSTTQSFPVLKFVPLS